MTESLQTDRSGDRNSDLAEVSRISAALQFAAAVHAKQYRKGGSVPYLGHLLGVCSLVLENGGTEDQAIAALLHDAIEDQAEAFGGADKLRAEIRARFGENVLRIVEGCTDADVIPKPPWKERKEKYITHLQHVGEDVLLVSAADKLYNARSIVADFQQHGAEVWDRFKGGKSGTLWYYRELVKAFKQRVNGWIFDELERVVGELERGADV